MKRILSLALALCLVIGGALSLAACGRVTERDLEKDAYTALNSAFENTLNAFFTDDAGIEKIIEKAQKKGSVELLLKSEDMFGDLTKLDVTIYGDQKKELVMADAAITYQDKNISALVWGDKTGIGVESKSLLGTSDALRLNYDNFLDKFTDSDLFELTGMEPEDATELLAILKQAFETLQTSAAEMEKESRDLANRLYEALDQSISTEDADNADGEEVSHLVTTYSLTDSNLRAMFKIIKEELTSIDSLTRDEKEELSEQLDEMIEEIDEAMDLNITLKIYILPKENVVSKITLDGKLTVKAGFGAEGDIAPLDTDSSTATVIDLEAELTFSATEIALNVDIETGEQDFSVDISIEKETTKNDVTYELRARAALASVTVDLLKATYTYDKETGDITIELDVMETESSRTKITINAMLEVEKNSFTLSLYSVKAGGETISFSKKNAVSITVEALDTLPSIPENTTDVVDVTEEEWLKIVEHVSDLFVKRLSGTYTASVTGMTDISYTFDGDEVTLSTEVFGSSTSCTGTYSIEDSEIVLDFPDNETFSGTYDFWDNGDSIVINGVTYEKVVD